MTSQTSIEFEPKELLIALLAVQNDLIQRNDFLEAARYCFQNKDQRLLQQLYTRKLLDKPDIAALKQLFERHLERQGQDPTQSLATQSAFGSILDELRRVADESQVTVTGAWVAQTADHASTPNSAMNSTNLSKEGANRFRLVREHARGGLGVVYVAEDTALRREVVVKQIRRDRMSDHLYREKFVVEAKVTGNLEHPGIVPVYALGTDNSGSPYYAMRFIRGQDLSKQIQEFHQLVRQKRAKLDGPELRALIRRFIDVCNAIEYAHDRGVLHRDLKPGNIMLGKHGETLVVDWGLAKVIDKKETATQKTNLAKEELPVGSNVTADNSHTTYGAFVGTPSYAPPEQLLGKLDEIGPASDVYALGAILYELLTSYRTVQGKDLNEIIAKVTGGKIQPPHARNKSVPKSLSAVCMKALATRPANRYASVNALRNDMEAWLDDLPIVAKQDGITDKIQRWLRKNRTVAVATIFASAIIASVSIFSAFALNVMRNSELAAKKDAEDQRDKANSARDEEKKARVAENHAKVLAERRLEDVQKNIYLSNIRLAAAKWETSDIGGMLKSLDALRPAPGEKDQREWEWHYLWNLCHKEVFKIDTRNEYNFGNCLDINTGHVFTAMQDGTVLLFDLQKNNAQSILQKLPEVLSANLSPDGTIYAVLHWDSTVSILDSKSGKLIRTLKPATPQKRYGGPLSQLVQFHPTGKALATVTSDSSTCIWETTSGKLLCQTPPQKSDMVSSLAFSPTDPELAVCLFQLGTKFFSTIDGSEIRRADLSSEYSGAHSCYSSDGKYLTLGGSNGTVGLLNIKTGKIEREWRAHDNVIFALAVSPDGTQVATSGRDRAIKIWSLPDGNLLSTKRGHTLTVRHLKYTEDSKLLISGGADGVVRIWDTTPDQIAAKTAEPTGMALASPDNRYIIKSSNKSIVITDLKSGRKKEIIPPMPFSSVAISPDNKKIAYSMQQFIFLVDVSQSKNLAAIEYGKGNVDSLLFSLDGKQLLRTEKDGTLIANNTDDGKEIRRIRFTEEKERVVAKLAWTDNPKTLLVMTGSKVLFYDFPLLEPRKELELGFRTGNVYSDYSHHSKKNLLVAAPGLLFNELARTCYLWDTFHLTKKEMRGHSECVTGVTINSNGNRVFSAGFDNTLRVWDPESGNEIVSFSFEFPLAKLHRSQDDSTLVAFGYDGNKVLLDGENSEQNPQRQNEIQARFLIGKHLPSPETQLQAGISAIKSDPNFPPEAKDAAVKILKSSVIEMQ